jgi:hypothetical protein
MQKLLKVTLHTRCQPLFYQFQSCYVSIKRNELNYRLILDNYFLCGACVLLCVCVCVCVRVCVCVCVYIYIYIYTVGMNYCRKIACTK